MGLAVMRWLAAPLLLLLIALSACTTSGDVSRSPLSSPAAEFVATPPPSESFLSGTLVDIEGQRLAVRQDGDRSSVIELEVTQESRIWKGEDVGLSAAEVGDRVFATIKKRPDGTREGVQVYLNMARADGRIGERQGTTFIIHGIPEISPHTDVAIIRVGPSTQYHGGNDSDLQVGRNVTVYGVQEKDGAIRATRIFFGVGATPSP